MPDHANMHTMKTHTFNGSADDLCKIAENYGTLGKVTKSGNHLASVISFSGVWNVQDFEAETGFSQLCDGEKIVASEDGFTITVNMEG